MAQRRLPALSGACLAQSCATSLALCPAHTGQVGGRWARKEQKELTGIFSKCFLPLAVQGPSGGVATQPVSIMFCPELADKGAGLPLVDRGTGKAHLPVTGEHPCWSRSASPWLF